MPILSTESFAGKQAREASPITSSQAFVFYLKPGGAGAGAPLLQRRLLRRFFQQPSFF
jgi:hypothetical protein